MSWARAVGITAAAAIVLLAGCALVRPASRPPGPQVRSHVEEDVVYLNDGGVLRGIIVERVPGTSLSLRTSRGTAWVLQESKIRRVEERSARAATGTPVVRLSERDLVDRWVRIEADRIGTIEGPVARIDADTVVVRRMNPGLVEWRPTKIPRAAIRNALVSTSATTRSGEYAVLWGLGSAVGCGLAGSFFQDANADAWRAAAMGGAVGAILGAIRGHRSVVHGGWRRLDLTPTSTSPPVGSRAVPAVAAGGQSD